ncbi:dermonecrotic toxin domain-containing protein [Pseudomonas atagonensis]|uniref:dermonecrotic toxin domain-containing protein n=1 Tax=Pseudomonas atagonensis TaxID=2609964 RepID=UPI0014086E55|nr:DUF6543 domain-containing protein [Pseudomonas atagonensis]
MAEDKSVQERLAEIMEANKELSIQLVKVPGFKNILQDILLFALQKIDPDVYVSKVFINNHSNKNASTREPVGAILDVLLQSLLEGRAPVYNPAEFGVYEWRNSNDDADRHPTLTVQTVGLMIAELLQGLPEQFALMLDRYWSAPQGKDANGRVLPTALNVLRVQHTRLFWHELALLTAEGGLSPTDQEAINRLTSPAVASAFHDVSIKLKSGQFAPLASVFVLRLSGESLGAIIPKPDNAVVLYTPGRGLEKFSTSAALHETLAKRLQASESRAELIGYLSRSDAEQVGDLLEIRYPRIDKDIFSTCVEGERSKQRANVTYHLRQMESVRAANEERLLEIGAALSMEGMLIDARNRTASLMKLMSANARPHWLKSAYVTNQELHAGLERELLRSEVDLHELTKTVASFQAYARYKAEEFLSPGTDERVDPDTVFVKTRHMVTLADGKKIEINERKTLTQVYLYGAYDKEALNEIALEEKSDNPKLNPASILRSIQALNVRQTYNAARQQVYARPEVTESLREVSGRKTALSIFSAILQKHVSPAAHDMVQRYNFGDTSIETLGVTLGSQSKPMHGLMVYRRRDFAVSKSGYVLYAPDFPGGQEWFEFADLERMQRQLLRWALSSEERTYLKSKLYASENSRLDDFEKVKSESDIALENWWKFFELARWTESGPLMASVANSIRWADEEVETFSPRWWRESSVSDQNLLNRLNADFKAVYQISKGQLDITPFHSFSRTLVKKALNQYLNRSGNHPEIDPDEVWVKFHASSKISLTNLFIQWQLWRSDVSIFERIYFNIMPGGGVIVDLKDRLREASFSTFSGQPIAALNAKVITDLIDLLPGERYLEYLQARFLDTPGIELNVNYYRKLKQVEMLRSALTQKMKGSLSAEQFNWLKAMIEGLEKDLPSKAMNTSGAPDIGVYEFTLEGRLLHGAYVFGRAVGSRKEFIVYVPGTRDEKDFIALEDLPARLRDFAFNRHLLQLVRMEHRGIVKNSIEKYWRSSTLLPQPSLTNSYQIRRFENEYRAMIGRFIADVDYQTTSPAEAVWEDAKILIDFAIEVVSLFVPPVGLVASVLRITQSVIQGIVASSHGDSSSANAYFAAAWKGAISLYIGKVSAIGSAATGVGLLSSIKDIADLVSTVTGVPVGIGYVTAVAAPPATVESTTRLIG